jgi:hypothetical protein
MRKISNAYDDLFFNPYYHHNDKNLDFDLRILIGDLFHSRPIKDRLIFRGVVLIQL